MQGAAEQHVRRYFFVAMILGFFLGFYAFLPLLFYKGLEQSSRKRKYFISGVFAGICLCIVLNALLVTFLFLFVLNGARYASAVAAVDGTFTSF